MIGNLFRFSGRASRKTFWLTLLLLIAISFAMSIVLGVFAGVGAEVLGGAEPSVTAALFGGGLVGIVMIVVYVAIFVISLAISVRRLHDLDRSAWFLVGYYLITIVLSAVAYATMTSGPGDSILSAVAGIIQFVLAIAFLIYLGFIRGTEGPNRFGPDPHKAN